MSKAFKTEADIRAEKKAAEGGAKIDSSRRAELDGMLGRLGSIAAVFQMRADSVPVPAFRRMRELMDIYIAAGIRGVKEGHDFLAQGVKLSEAETNDLQRIMSDVFGVGDGGDKGKDAAAKK